MEEGGYEASDEELEDRLRAIAERQDTDVRDVRRRLAREGRLEGMREHIATEKLFEQLKKESKIIAS